VFSPRVKIRAPSRANRFHETQVERRGERDNGFSRKHFFTAVDSKLNQIERTAYIKNVRVCARARTAAVLIFIANHRPLHHHIRDNIANNTRRGKKENTPERGGGTRSVN